MNQNKMGQLKDEGSATKIVVDNDASEASWAAHDFALEVKQTAARVRGVRMSKDYEVRPCKSVRGHILRLPVTGWAFWFPTVDDALSYTRKLADIHQAQCCVYDSEGGVLSRSSVLDMPGASAN